MIEITRVVFNGITIKAKDLFLMWDSVFVREALIAKLRKGRGEKAFIEYKIGERRIKLPLTKCHRCDRTKV